MLIPILICSNPVMVAVVLSASAVAKVTDILSYANFYGYSF